MSAAARASLFAALATVGLLLGGCEQSGDLADAGFLGEQGEASAPMGTCAAVEQRQQIEGWVHEPVCSYIKYFTNPPSSGNHYPIWAAYKSYTSPVPEGFFVHDLEHGAIVLTYNCARYGAGVQGGADGGIEGGVGTGGGVGGCEGDVAAAQAMLDSLPPDTDSACAGTGVTRRVLMTPDPNLDVPFAASAWGWTLRAQCFDPVTFAAFATAHYNQGREDICGQGDDVSTGLQAGCGEP